MLFDVKKYELPHDDEVDWLQTKTNLGIFLGRYKTVREKMKLPVSPKLSERYFLGHDERVTENNHLFEESYQEFEQIHGIFISGMLAIVHPFKPEVSDRRRKVFILRYMYGFSIPLVSDRIHYQKNIIVDDSKMAILQFTAATELLCLKN
ncbi:hypothetical protein BH739_01315 [Enterococcus casseliflavus]|nr:hypothetical protein BH739_01315 [Enterococcus casseliflavus]